MATDSTPATILPEGFEDLESAAREWALPNETERTRRRYASSQEELEALYRAVLPRLDAILAHLDALPLDRLPADARRLLHLTLALAEVAPAVEYLGQPQVLDGREGAAYAARFTPLHED